MLLVWLGTTALAASPDLHRRFHADAQEPNHQCVVTQVHQQSLLWTPGVAIAPAVLTPVCGPLPIADAGAPCEADHRFSPSRAPPIPRFSSGVVG